MGFEADFPQISDDLLVCRFEKKGGDDRHCKADGGLSFGAIKLF